jgi:serine protease Do
MAVWRDGQRQTLELRVGEIAPEAAAVAKQAPAKQEDARLGMAVRELMPAERKLIGEDYGLVVVEVAQRPGPGSSMLPGDVIVGVNQSRFKSRQEFEKLIGAHRKGDMVALLVRRGEVSLYVPVEIG